MKKFQTTIQNHWLFSSNNKLISVSARSAWSQSWLCPFTNTLACSCQSQWRNFLGHIIKHITPTKGILNCGSRYCDIQISIGNRSVRELGNNFTCEQIGLFLISGTRGCGSHEWKLLKSPICSRVQLIPNCFEKKDRFHFNNAATVNTNMSQVCNMKLNFIGLKAVKRHERLFDKWKESAHGNGNWKRYFTDKTRMKTSSGEPRYSVHKVKDTCANSFGKIDQA